MPAPYGLHIIENCVECKLRQPKHFCDLHPAALKQLDEAKSNVTYPADSILFMEGQEAHGMFLLCRGRVKLSISSADGKSVIVNIAEPGEALGLSAILPAGPIRPRLKRSSHAL